MNDNLYRTPEIVCWSRNFTYEDYILYHNNCAKPLTKIQYDKFCVMMSEIQELV